MATNPSSNMNLPIPQVGVEPGPDWATDINDSLTIIDSHDHSTGSGVQITPDGLNINSDLTMGQNNLIDIKSLRLSEQNTPLAGSSDLTCLYASGVDLYFNDGNGNQIQVTQNGGIAGSPGSISNLTSPASASYVAADSTFVWQSDTNVAANLDAGSLVLRNLTVNSKGLTLSPPNSMAANYSLVLPALPVSQKFMALDASGNMSAPWAVDNSTIVIAANIVKVPASGITSNEIANDAVITAKIPDQGVTRPKMIAVGQQISSSSGSFQTTSTSYVDVTNLTVTITTTGRPVMLMVAPADTSDDAYIGTTKASNQSISDFQIVRDSTVVSRYAMRVAATGATSVNLNLPPSAIMYLDTPAAGTYTYKVQAKADGRVDAYLCKLVAYEL